MHFPPCELVTGLQPFQHFYLQILGCNFDLKMIPTSTTTRNVPGRVRGTAVDAGADAVQE
jgi:hypothetical protein